MINQNRKLIKTLLKIWILPLLLLCFVGCKEDDSIPIVYVNFSLPIDLPSYSDLEYSGGHVYINYIDGHTAGVRGVIVYRAGLDQFMAYDAACPYDWESGGLAKVDDNLLTLTCSKCNSQFILLDGSPFKGKSKIGLKSYHTYFHADKNIVTVTN